MLQKFTLPFAILGVSGAVANLLYLQAEPPQTNEIEQPTMLVDVVRARLDSAQVVVKAQGTHTDHHDLGSSRTDYGSLACLCSGRILQQR